MARAGAITFELQSLTAGREWDATTVTGGGVTINTNASFVRSGAASLKIIGSASASNYITHQVLSADGVLVTSFKIMITAFPTDTNGAIIQHLNAAGTVGASISIETNGTLKLFDGNIAGTQRGSASAALSLNSWYIIELKTENGGSPEIEARVGLDGATPTVFASGAMTTATGMRDVDLGMSDWLTSYVAYIDDVVFDTANYPGYTRFDRHFIPTSAGDASDWTNDYLSVDDVTPDDNTTFAASGTTSGNKDLHNVDAPSRITGLDTVVAVYVGMRFNRGTSAGTNATIRTILRAKAGGTSANGTTETANTTTWRTHGITLPRNYRLISTTSPDTGLAYTPSEIGSLQIGYELTNTPSAGRDGKVTVVWAEVEYVPGPIGKGVSDIDNTAGINASQAVNRGSTY